MSLDDYFEALPLQERLKDFDRLAQDAEPQELQRLMRLIVERIEWMPDGIHAVEFRRPRVTKSATLGNCFAPSNPAKNEKTANLELEYQWFDGDLRSKSIVRSGGANHSTCELPVFGIGVTQDLIPHINGVHPLCCFSMSLTIVIDKINRINEKRAVVSA